MIEVKAISFKNDIPFLVSILDATISCYFTLCFWLEVRYELKNPSVFPGVSAKEMKEMKQRKEELLQWNIVLRGLTVEMMILCFLLVFLHSGNRKTRVWDPSFHWMGISRRISNYRCLFVCLVFVLATVNLSTGHQVHHLVAQPST